MTKKELDSIKVGTILSNRAEIAGMETGYDYRVIEITRKDVTMEVVGSTFGSTSIGNVYKVSWDSLASINVLYVVKPKAQDVSGYPFSDLFVFSYEIKPGDVVIEGTNYEKPMFRTLTNVDGDYWEYFDEGSYHSTSPACCHWKVDGQSHCREAKLIKIICSPSD